MRMIDIIEKKKLGKALSSQEIEFFVREYTDGNIPDYQAAALLMAVRLMGMNSEETAALTIAMAKSGEQSDLSKINGIKVDKHSSGGVGDKTTLIVAPIVAACGVPVAKMSGRGLGHTGGTLDKLESIPGFKIILPKERFFEIVNSVGFSLIGQSGNLAPADKKLYALRDVTATVDSIPLIASSIMSKKLASGADAIVLDVKSGSGAFMKDIPSAVDLAQQMVEIGNRAGRKTAALITNMNSPLGKAIGNSLEVIEAIECLKNRGEEDLTNLCVELAAYMLLLAEKGSLEECRILARKTLEDGSALRKFAETISAQGGDARVIDDYSIFPQAKFFKQIFSQKSAYISEMDCQGCGISAMILGAGRAAKEDLIDHSAGIILAAKVGDFVEEGQLLATLYTNNQDSLSSAESLFMESLTFSQQKPPEFELIFKTII